MSNGEGRAERQLAPAVTGRERTDKDPPIMEQWKSEIDQVTGFLGNQTDRIRAYTDRMFGPQPRNEEESDKKDMIAEVQPSFDQMGGAIMSLHRAKDELLEQIERLEGHRLV